MIQPRAKGNLSRRLVGLPRYAFSTGISNSFATPSQTAYSISGAHSRPCRSGLLRTRPNESVSLTRPDWRRSGTRPRTLTSLASFRPEWSYEIEDHRLGNPWTHVLTRHPFDCLRWCGFHGLPETSSTAGWLFRRRNGHHSTVPLLSRRHDEGIRKRQRRPHLKNLCEGDVIRDQSDRIT